MRVITIPYRPRPSQLEIHKQMDMHRWSVVVAHRRFGKTVAVVNQLIKAGTRCPLRNPRYAYIAPFRGQAKLIAWDYLKMYTRAMPGTIVNETELHVTLANGARISLFGADNPDSIRGIYLDGVVMDEYADMKPSLWNEVVRPLLADREGFAIFIGTPRGLDQFHEMYQTALYNDSWFAGMYPVDQTGVVSEKELEEMRATMTENAFRQEMYCDFTASGDDVYIPLSLVEPALGKRLGKHEYIYAPKIMAVGVARFGDDSTEIYMRQGLFAAHVETINQLDTMQVSAMVVHHIKEQTPHAVFIDETGIGSGVVDRVRQLGYDVIGVNAGGVAMKPAAYKNKRAEMWGLLKQWLQDGGALPNDRQLASQISTPFYEFDPSNRVVLEKKSDMKKRGLKSPDKADALAMTFAMPIYWDYDASMLHQFTGRQEVAMAATDYPLFGDY